MLELPPATTLNQKMTKSNSFVFWKITQQQAANTFTTYILSALFFNWKYFAPFQDFPSY